MRYYRIIIGLIYGLINALPFVSADLKAGPEIYVIPVIGLVLVGGFIVSAIFIIKWIIRKIKNKQ